MDGPVNTINGAFPQTHWSSIYAAGSRDDLAGQKALNRLLERYREPLLFHLKQRFRVSEDQAEDWLHSFVEKKVLEKDLLKSADSQRGRFRTFLLNSLDHFVIDELRRSSRDKRCPENGFVHLDSVLGNKEPLANPEYESFDLNWARAVLAEALEEVRNYYTAKQRPDLWNIFERAFVQPTLSETEPPPLAELAAQFGFQSASQASNALITAKRLFKSRLEAVISEYAEDAQGVRAEVCELLAILGEAE